MRNIANICRGKKKWNFYEKLPSVSYQQEFPLVEIERGKKSSIFMIPKNY